MKLKSLIWVVLIPCFAFSQEIKKDYHETFDVDEGSVLHLKHGDGDVTMIPWDKDVIDVTVRYRAEFRTFGIGSERDFEVEFRQSGDDVYVVGKERGTGFTVGIQKSRRFIYTYKIKAPNYVILNFSGDDGEVTIENWKADIQCNLDDGDIHLRDIEADRTKIFGEDGNVRIENLNSDLTIDVDDGDIHLRDCDMSECRIRGEDGEVTIRNAEGDFDISVDDGDVNLFRVKPNQLFMKSNDGDFDLNLLKSDNSDIDISTDDGRVVLRVEKGFSADFLLDSDDGRIRVNVPDVHNYERGRHRKAGQIGSGKGRIRVHTNGGDISLREL